MIMALLIVTTIEYFPFVPLSFVCLILSLLPSRGLGHRSHQAPPQVRRGGAEAENEVGFLIICCMLFWMH